MYLIGLLIVSFATFLGCEPVRSEEVTESSRYYPLKTGAEWKLEGVGTTPEISFKIVGKKEINGTVYFEILQTHVYDKEQQITIYARFQNNQVYWLIPPLEERLIFDFYYPLNHGPTLPYISDDATVETRTGRIIDTGMTVEVPAGKFENCLVYEVTDTSRKIDEPLNIVVYTYWLAPDIGIVKLSVNNIASASAPVDQWLNNLSSYSIPE